ARIYPSFSLLTPPLPCSTLFPYTTLFRSKPPKREGSDSQSPRSPHFVQGGNSVHEPDVMTVIVLIEVAEMRIQAAAIEMNIFFRVTGSQPCFLRRDRHVIFAGGQLAFFAL